MAINYPQRYDDDFLNKIKTVIDHVNAHGKTIQDLVAEGQLTPEQYAELITVINGLIKSGHVDKSDLTPEFRDEIEEFNVQLAQTTTELEEINESKADKSFTINELDKKRDKSTPIRNTDLDTSSDGTKINLINLSDEVKQSMAGDTPINATVGHKEVTEEKIADKAVSHYKVDGYKTGVNLFDINRITLNTLPDENTGELVYEQDGYATSEFIPVEPSTDYYLSYAHRVVWYDINNQYISGTPNPGGGGGIVRTSPSNAAYVRFGLTPVANSTTDKWKRIMFHKGTEPIPFEPYRKIINNLESDRLIEVVNSDKTLNFDESGRIKSVVEVKGGRTMTTFYTFDSEGNLTTVTQESEGLRTIETLNYQNGKYNGSNKTVETIWGA